MYVVLIEHPEFSRAGDKAYSEECLPNIHKA